MQFDEYLEKYTNLFCATRHEWPLVLKDCFHRHGLFLIDVCTPCYERPPVLRDCFCSAEGLVSRQVLLYWYFQMCCSCCSLGVATLLYVVSFTQQVASLLFSEQVECLPFTRCHCCSINSLPGCLYWSEDVIQVLRNVKGRWGGIRICADQLFEGVRSNVISVTRDGRVSNFQKKVLCVTLVWPLTMREIFINLCGIKAIIEKLDSMCYNRLGWKATRRRHWSSECL